MVRSFTEGIAFIRSPQGRAVECINPRTGGGLCKERTREAFLVSSNGTGTAAADWASAPDRHPGGRPEDAPAYSFGWATGGSAGSGHVWVNLGGGRILTPGGPDDPHHWHETTTRALFTGWRTLRYAGWTRTIDGKAPALPAAAKVDTGSDRPKRVDVAIDDAQAAKAKAHKAKDAAKAKGKTTQAKRLTKMHQKLKAAIKWGKKIGDKK